MGPLGGGGGATTHKHIRTYVQLVGTVPTVYMITPKDRELSYIHTHMLHTKGQRETGQTYSGGAQTAQCICDVNVHHFTTEIYNFHDFCRTVPQREGGVANFQTCFCNTLECVEPPCVGGFFITKNEMNSHTVN